MLSASRVRTKHDFASVSMDTWVNIQVVSDQPREVIEPTVQGALAWFETVERICTRFDPSSEVMQLIGQVGHPVMRDQAVAGGEIVLELGEMLRLEGVHGHGRFPAGLDGKA